MIPSPESDARFYVYVDWTLESLQRPFYVGKGSGKRCRISKRNWSHRKVRNEFGILRKIEFMTSDENAAFLEEARLIEKYHTFVSDPFYNGIGCNFTGGGLGGIRPSAETRRKIGESNKRRRGEKRSTEARKRISEGIQKAFKEKPRDKLSIEHRQKISNGLKGHKVSIETREKLSEASKQLHQNAEIKQRITEALRNSISIRVLEIDPISEKVIKEHETMKSAVESSKLGHRTFRKALKNNRDEYLIAKTGRKWKIKSQYELN